MDSRQLTYFLAVVDCAGFGRAAEQLHVAQPSLSQAIRTLERQLGTPLFHRNSRGIELTEAGRALVPPARQVQRDLQAAGEVIDDVKGLRSGRLDIAGMPSPAVAPLSEMISAFTDLAPDVTVNVLARATADEVVEVVRSGVCEIGVLGTPHPLHDSTVVTHRLRSQRFVLVAAESDDLPSGDIVQRERLDGMRLIVGPQGTGMRLLIEEMRSSGLNVRIAVETAHREAILTLVANGVGNAVLTDAWASIARQLGLRVFALEPPAYLGLWLVTRASPITAAAETFWTMAGGPTRSR
ncbi:LysR family transcriptional regulator [Allosaccharopolyspora coralli]|uniref:LysR family transcriptional regulator n=1 Tax=Allosaccharopolyspora coralli TaxID=2665642 RepID=A0A5Q3Q8L3_9PSEU|nr:LysR family transcriptional regulator [Allosaccharopolyspora coralli]QGK70713.1 LysR family transcriptional regulator [Allosaccharopolyspora coralli]